MHVTLSSRSTINSRKKKNLSTRAKNEGMAEKKSKSRRLIDSRNIRMLIFLQVIASTKEVGDYKECLYGGFIIT